MWAYTPSQMTAVTDVQASDSCWWPPSIYQVDKSTHRVPLCVPRHHIATYTCNQYKWWAVKSPSTASWCNYR